MGGRTCKTSHLGKNTLKNRRFLESNNADSGEHVQGLPKRGVWGFGLDAGEVLSPGAGWTLPLSTGPLRPQALPSAPCPFLKSEGSHSICAFTFGELASALSRARACLLLPALSLATSYLTLVLVQALPPLRGPARPPGCWQDPQPTPEVPGARPGALSPFGMTSGGVF